MRKRFKFTKFLCLLSAGRLIKDGGRILWSVDTPGGNLLFKVIFSGGRPYLAPSPENNRWQIIGFIAENIFLLDEFLTPAFRDSEEYQMAIEIAKEQEQLKFISFISLSN